ncbi:hypothetical protein TNCV_346151 [Trichonephila clavipes]|nr:hypothetical protein TNCV_346151 [Trichonephila clavipes]
MSKRNRSLDQPTLYNISSTDNRRIFFKKKERISRASSQVKKCVVPDDARLASVGNHIPKMLSNDIRCRKCSKKGQEKRTRYLCPECDVPLCIATCFSHIFIANNHQ